MNASQIRNTFNLNYQTVKNLAEDYRTEHLDWIKTYGTEEYFHPDLIKIIVEKLVQPVTGSV